MNKESFNNVSTGERVARVVAGLALVYSVVLQPGALGVAAVLPLVAVYPILTGVLGWDPVYQMVARFQQRRINRTTKGNVTANQM